MLAKKTAKNQLTLPKSIAGKFEGFDYFDISVKNNSSAENSPAYTLSGKKRRLR